MIRPSVLLACFLFPLCCTGPPDQVSDQDAIRLSQAIDSSIRYKKPRYFNSLINEKAMAKKIALASEGRLTIGELRDLRNSVAGTDLGDNIIRATLDGGMYELVRTYNKNGSQHAVFRLYAGGGLNYHDFELTKSNGRTSIADIYVYSSGEDFSKTLADLMLTVRNRDRETVDRVKALTRLKDLVSAGEFEKAAKYYDQMPGDMKTARAIQLLYVRSCSGLGTDTYLQALDGFRSRFPGEPNLDLLSIDGYIMHKQYGNALAAIDRLDSSLGKDPFLDFFRASVYNLDDQPFQAISHLERLHNNMPGWDDGALELIANYISAGDDNKARSLIAEYEKNPDFDQALLADYLFTQPRFSRQTQ